MLKTLLLYFVLVFPFLYLSYQSVNRYLLFQIAVASTPIEMKNKQFPSLSICTQYAIKKQFRGTVYKIGNCRPLRSSDWHARFYCIHQTINCLFSKLFNLVLDLKEVDINLNDLQGNISESYWKRNETFYYVDYPNEKNSGFECMTIKDSNDPRKPCRFPYLHHQNQKTSNE